MPCLMSPKSSIQVQLKPMENHSTGMLMNVMEIPRARMILREHKRPPCYTILLSINKTSACITEEQSDEEPFRPKANVLLDGSGRLNLGLVLGRRQQRRRHQIRARTSASSLLSGTAELLQKRRRGNEDQQRRSAAGLCTLPAEERKQSTARAKTKRQPARNRC